MPNRLARSTSPYLLQHADNPVDWWEWGDEAFAEAERRGVPVLLSVGYAACHWCHVMAHESFEDEQTAWMMNAGFVNVKVDREERPDVDAVYMEALQATQGSGGWPMTCLLTPSRDPFFCGTYFPLAQFQRLLASVTQAWSENRKQIERSGAALVERLQEHFGSGAAGPPVSVSLLDAAVDGLVGAHDDERGGFGGAPKFPPSMVLELLLRSHARTARADALAAVDRTCEAMARGGMYDQLAGGFARYSVDADWVVPHFEKMLYDNALLLRAYLHLWRTTASPLAERVVRETVAFLLRDLRTAEGGFASALDADAAGREGLTYVWTPDELSAVLGPDDGAWAAQTFTVTPGGTFEEGASVLQRLAEPDDADRYARVRAALLDARAKRPQPARDDKVVTSWNGYVIAALAEAGALLDEPECVRAAEAAAELLHDLHLVDGRLRRVSRDGRVGQHAAVLEDYGALATGWLALYATTGATRWLDAAGLLLDVVLTRFADPAGGFFDTADDAEQLLRRPQDPTDNATPSGASAAAGALVTYAAATGSPRHREAAEAALRRVTPLLGGHARFAGEAAAVAEALVAGPLEVAVVDRPDLLAVARLGTSPGAVVVTGGPLVADRPEPAVYVCQNFACDRPLSDAASVAGRLIVTAAQRQRLTI